MTKKKDENALFESIHELRNEDGSLYGYAMEPTAEHRAAVEKWLVPFNDGNPPVRVQVKIPTIDEIRYGLESYTGALGILSQMYVPGFGKVEDMNLTGEQKQRALDMLLKTDHSFSVRPCTTCGSDLLTPWDLLGEDQKAVMSEIGLGGTVNEPTILSVKSIDEMAEELTVVLGKFRDSPAYAEALEEYNNNPRPYLTTEYSHPGKEVLEQRRLSLPHQIPTIKLSAIGNQVDELCVNHKDDSEYPPAAEGESYDIKQSEPSIFSDKWHMIPGDWIRWRLFDKFGYTTSASTELITVDAMLKVVKEAEVIRRKLRALRLSRTSNSLIKKPEFYVPGTRLISLQWVAWIATERGITFEEAFRNSIKD